jgi:hypothetical protein
MMGGSRPQRRPTLAEPLESLSERVEDLHVWLVHWARMGVPPLRDAYVPRHGTWVGVRLGWGSVRWLPPLLSAAHPRRHHVDPWAAPRLQPLRRGPGPPVHPLARPTTARRLQGIEGLPRTLMRAGRRRRSPRTPLARVQRRMLALRDGPVDLSARRCPDAHPPPST